MGQGRGLLIPTVTPTRMLSIVFLYCLPTNHPQGSQRGALPVLDPMGGATAPNLAPPARTHLPTRMTCASV
jgi:hypothetical protein